MAEADFTLRLIDEMTGPMREIAGELKELRRAFEAVDRRSDEVNKSLRSTGDTAAREGKRVRRLSDDFRAGFQVFTGNLLTAGFFAVTRGIETMVSSALGAAKDLTRSVLEMGVFGEKTQKSFELIAGSVSGGERAMDQVLKLSQELSLGFQDTAVAMQQLMAQSFSMEEATGLIEMVADLKQMGVEGERAQRVLMALTQIRAKGKLQAEEMLQLAEAGIPLAKVREELMGIMNVDLQELEKLQMKGQVNPDAALEAVQRAVNNTLGIARSGDAGREFARSTIQGAMDGFSTARELFLLEVAKDSKSAFNSLSPAINAVSAALKDARVIDNVVKGFEALISAATDKNTIDAVTDAIKLATAAFRRGSEIFSSFMSGFMEELAPGISESLKNMDQPISEETRESIREVGKIMGDTADSVRQLMEAVGSFTGWFGKGIGDASKNYKAQMGREMSIIDAITDPIAWADIGWHLIKGLADGILSGKGEAEAAAREVSKGVELAAKSTLDVHSPSRLFEDIGMNLDKGMAIGMRANDNAVRASVDLGESVTSAFESMMPSRNATGSFAGSPVARSAVTSSTNNYNFGGVNASTEVRTDRPEAAASITSDGLVSAMLQALARSKAAA